MEDVRAWPSLLCLRGHPLGVRQVEGGAIPTFASGPLGATPSDLAWRKPRKFPRGLGQFPAFLPGRVSVGPRSFGQPRSLKAWLRYIHKVTVRRKTINCEEKAAIETYSCSFQKPMKSDSRGKVRVIFLNILFRMHCELRRRWKKKWRSPATSDGDGNRT